ncbi:hypothetical protein CANARDRAFT_29777 [[Candida] arabinofermentans NRRL YB-2248]|uniref:Yos1-like protein n=1 Tax=[Candida] arabinofermentans NRRL YB-2248 TaxID=983967 RepID=A0A1E4SWB6_9ASCO|nr:hypothetical protein CANARDRAFT_29777 [[Candida] arabinofermentans NRRL YB-2248]
MFGLGTLFYSILFLVNGIAVLSEDRFLNRIGWGSSSSSMTPNSSASLSTGGGYDYLSGDSSNSMSDINSSGIKSRIVNLIGATRTLLRFPLILVNVIVIIYELVLG